MDGQTFEFHVAAVATMASLLVEAGLSLNGLSRADLISPDGRRPARRPSHRHENGRTQLALACVCFLAVRAGSRAAITALGAVAGLLQGFYAITALQWWAIAVPDGG